MQQWWSRAATFINTFVNPIGLDNIGWKYYIWYCCWITVEGVVIYLFFPETAGRTLEELSFCKTSLPAAQTFHLLIPGIVFEGEEVRAEVAAKVEKQVGDHEHHEVVHKELQV